MEDQLFELMLSKMDDLKEQQQATHTAVTSFNEKLEKHIKDDQELARDVWVVKRVFQATWGAVVGLGGLYLAWMGIGQK